VLSCCFCDSNVTCLDVAEGQFWGGISPLGRRQIQAWMEMAQIPRALQLTQILGKKEEASDHATRAPTPETQRD